MVYNESFKDASIANNPSPFRYVIYRKREHTLDFIERWVYELAELTVPSEMGMVPVVHGVYGLSVKDLLAMDYAEFCRVERKVNNFVKEHTPPPRKDVDPYKELRQQQQQQQRKK